MSDRMRDVMGRSRPVFHCRPCDMILEPGDTFEAHVQTEQHRETEARNAFLSQRRKEALAEWNNRQEADR